MGSTCTAVKSLRNYFFAPKNLLCTAVETDHDQQEYEEEECESGEGVDYRGCGGVGHHPDELLLCVPFPPLEGSFRGPWACLAALSGWAYGGEDRGVGCWSGAREATAICSCLL